MVSICLKSLDNQPLDIIESDFDNIEFPGILYSQKKFKNYNNLILHYKGSNLKKFYDILADIISNYVIKNYEIHIINSQLKLEFFYFSTLEKNKILDNVKKILSSKKNCEQKKQIIKQSSMQQIKGFKNFYLDGFINFGLSSYKEFLYSILEQEIHDYALQKEYYEYVHLLREYISVKSPQASEIHLIYSEKEQLLLDNFGNIITTTGQKKYISDISFSTNDFILNSILSLMPEKLVIHLHDKEDNFIEFLKSIFEQKCHICRSCNLCTNYLAISKK